MIKYLELPAGWKKYNVASGSNCYILAGSVIEAFLFNKFRRRGLCLKVYEEPNIYDIENFDIEHIITEARIQNIFALFGIAPAVYRLAVLSNRRIAQVVEYVANEGEPDIYLANKLIKKFNLRSINVIAPTIDVEKFDLLAGTNWVGNKFVDFGGWHFGHNRGCKIGHRGRKHALRSGTKRRHSTTFHL